MALLLLPFWLSKFLPLPFQPIGFCLTAGAVGLILKRRAITAAGLLVLFLSSLGVVTDPLVRHLEEQYPALEIAACPPADAAVVLGGILPDDLRTSATEWGSAVDRFERGVELVQAGKAPLLVFTSARIPSQLDPSTEGSRLRKAAIKRGLPPERVLLTGSEVQNTAGEVAAIRQLIERHGWNRIILVTSALHMPRAMALMRKQQVKAVPFPADYRTGAHVRVTPFSFLPSPAVLEDAQVAVHEYLGMLYYRLVAG